MSSNGKSVPVIAWLKLTVGATVRRYQSCQYCASIPCTFVHRGLTYRRQAPWHVDSHILVWCSIALVGDCQQVLAWQTPYDRPLPERKEKQKPRKLANNLYPVTGHPGQGNPSRYVRAERTDGGSSSYSHLQRHLPVNAYGADADMTNSPEGILLRSYKSRHQTQPSIENTRSSSQSCQS